MIGSSAWNRRGSGIIESPHRSLVNPFVRYVEVGHTEHPDEITMVLIPEYVPRHWWERMLYNQNARRIREGLVGRPNVIVGRPLCAERQRFQPVKHR